MKMPRTAPRAAAVTCVLALAACLENEETIDVAPDGSVTVELRSKGDVSDLADGYPLPLDAPWEPLTDATRQWLRVLGADTGSASVRASLDERGWSFSDPNETELAVRRTFASVEDLPRWFAPPGDPYRDAHLRRDTRLDVRVAGGRTVYVLERTLRARGANKHVLFNERWEREIPDDVEQRFGKPDRSVSDAEVRQIADVLRASVTEIAELFVREALVGIWTEGDGSLPASAAAEIVARVQEAQAALVTDELVRRCDAFDAEEDAGDEREHPLETLERALRETLRATLADELVRRRVPLKTRNAVLYAAEHALTTSDATNDLHDEAFTIRVGMPGTIVAGNHQRLEGGRAVWELDGEELEQELVLRVVSVVD